MTTSRICKGCPKLFIPSSPRQFFHSRACSDAFSEASTGRSAIKLSSGTRGTIGELLVAADLLGKGFAVFRALSPSCACDLAILKDSKLVRVEVTTASLLQNGKPAYSKHDPAKYDVLALVFHNGKIIYEPEL